MLLVPVFVTVDGPLHVGGAVALVETLLGRNPQSEALATVLLSSYVHMTNNRLGVAILDEIYLSYLIQQSLTRPRVEAG